MENDNLIAGLIRKRAEITAQVEVLQIQLRQLIMDADNIDGAIRIFNPDIDLADIRPGSNRSHPPLRSGCQFRGDAGQR